MEVKVTGSARDFGSAGDCECDDYCESVHQNESNFRKEVEPLNLPEMNPPEGQGQGQGEQGAQGLRLIIQACQRLYPQQPNPLQVQ